MLTARLTAVVIAAALVVAVGTGTLVMLLPPRARPPVAAVTERRPVAPAGEPGTGGEAPPPAPLEEDTDRRLPAMPGTEEPERVVSLEPPVLAPIPLPAASETRPVLAPPPLPFPEAVKPRPRPRPEPVELVRLQEATESDLAGQLETVPEVALYTSFTQADATRLINQTMELRRRGIGILNTVPDPILAKAGLPVIRGEACRLSASAASDLQTGSMALREMLTGQVSGTRFATLRTVEADRPAALAEKLHGGPGLNPWLRPEAVPVLMQMMMAEDEPVREVLIDTLAKIDGPRACAALAVRACTDLSPGCRARAVKALASRPKAQYVGVLFRGLRHPWPPVASHAAEALASLKCKEAVPGLLQMLDLPDPSEPYAKPNRRVRYVRDLVRINHLRGCLLCHAQSVNEADAVRAVVPMTENAIGARGPYYGPKGAFVTARITYLRQDFSYPQIVRDPGKWPDRQRFDFITRERPATKDELTRKLVGITPHQKALTFALEKLTNKNPGPSPDDWKKLYLDRSLPMEKIQGGLTDATALAVDDNATAFIAESGRILKREADSSPVVWHEFEGALRGLALGADGGLFAAYVRARWLQRFDIGTKEKIPLGEGKVLLNDPRRPAADKHGGAYVCDGDGVVHHVAASGTFTRMKLGKVKVSHVAIGPAGDHLFLAAGADLWGCPVESPGVLGRPVRVARVASPGGITELAVDGRGLVSVLHGGGVDVITPEGLRLARAKLPAAPTAVVARGETLHVLTRDALYALDLSAVVRP